MNPKAKSWLQVSLFNLLLVATLGVVMRYKIVYALPWVDQKSMLHAHSHFAFAGWVTQSLMALLVNYLGIVGATDVFRRYRPVLFANLFAAYGMLLSFPFVGYSAISITFSTLSIFVSYWFAIRYWRDLNRLGVRSTVHRWFKAALVFNVIASLGAFYLAYMLASKSISPNNYLASVYFFLHFQYNGWFFFACAGLLSRWLSDSGADEGKLERAYALFAAACVPAYFLSALWLPIPDWIYWLVILSVFLQIGGWVQLLKLIRKAWPGMKRGVNRFARFLFILSAIALTIKLLLQAGSVIPSLSQLAFGFRPIIIGYLHLVLLGVITLFIMGYLVNFKLVPASGATIAGMVIFTGGVIANELLLMLQGVTDLNYTAIPEINHFLLAAALVLWLGMLVIVLSQAGKPRQ